MARVCTRCGDSYYRANRLRLWTGTDAATYKKFDEPVCLKCLPDASVKRIAIVTHIRVVPARRSHAS
jgi:hypothetical protein